MEVNFRYKSKDGDRVIRGLPFRADDWLETESRIPLSAREEALLVVEHKVNGEFVNVVDTEKQERENAPFMFSSEPKKDLPAAASETIPAVESPIEEEVKIEEKAEETSTEEEEPEANTEEESDTTEEASEDAGDEGAGDK